MSDRKDFESIFPHKPFFEIIEFFGSLSNGIDVVKDLQIVIQYPIDKPGKIDCRILGTANDAERICQLCDSNESYLSLRSTKKSSSHYQCEVVSEKVWCQSVTTKNGLKHSNYVVANLGLDEITKVEEFDHSPETEQEATLSNTKRRLTFYLAGPIAIWGIHWHASDSYTGNRKVTVYNSELHLGNAFPFSLFVNPWYFHEKSNSDDNYKLETYTYALELRTTRDQIELPDEEFVKIGKSLIDDLTILASLASRAWVVWFGYSLRTIGSLITFRKWTVTPGQDTVRWHEMAVARRHNRVFLSSCLRKYRDLRNNNISLLHAITYYLDGLDSKKDLEDSFTHLIFSLEKIKDSYANQNKLTEIFGVAEFDLIRSAVKDCLRNKVGANEKTKRAISKINELNRPSFRSVLKILFEHLNLDNSDLYPSTAKDHYAFIEVRNTLFHSSHSIESDTLFKETMRLKYIVERVLLRMLGWEDLSLSPSQSETNWLSS